MVQLFCFVGSRIYMDLLCFLWVWWTLMIMGLGTNRKLWVSGCFRLERLLDSNPPNNIKQPVVAGGQTQNRVVLWRCHGRGFSNKRVRDCQRQWAGRTRKKVCRLRKTCNHPGVEQKQDVNQPSDENSWNFKEWLFGLSSHGLSSIVFHKYVGASCCILRWNKK